MVIEMEHSKEAVGNSAQGKCKAIVAMLPGEGRRHSSSKSPNIRKPRSSSLESPRRDNEKNSGKGERTPHESHHLSTSLSLEKCKNSRSDRSPSRKESCTKERRGSRSPIEKSKSNRRNRRHSASPDGKEISGRGRRRHSSSPPGKDEEEETMSERKSCRRASLSPEDQDQSKHRRRRVSSSSPIGRRESHSTSRRNNMSRSDKIQSDQSSSRKKSVNPLSEERGQKNSRRRASLSLCERHRSSRQPSFSLGRSEEGENKHRRRIESINSEGGNDDRYPRLTASPEDDRGGATRSSKHDEDTRFIREKDSRRRRHSISPEHGKERLGEQRRRGRSASGHRRRKESISPRGDGGERNMTRVAVENEHRVEQGTENQRHSRSQSVGHRTVGSTGHESGDAVKNADNIRGRSFIRNETTRSLRRASSLIHFDPERNSPRDGGNKLNFSSREDAKSAGIKWGHHHAASLGSSPKVSDGGRSRNQETTSPRRHRKHKSEDDLFSTAVHRRNKSTENIFERSRLSSKRKNSSDDVARSPQNRHFPSSPRKDHDPDAGGELSSRMRRLTIDDNRRRMSPQRRQQPSKNVHPKEQQQDLPERTKKSSLRRTSSLGRFESTKRGPHHGRSLSVDRSDHSANGGQSSSDVPLQLRRSRMGFLDRDMAFGDSDDDDSSRGKEAEYGTKRHQQQLVDAIQQRMREREMNEFDYYPDDDLNAENGGAEEDDEELHVDLDKIDFTALNDEEKEALFDRLEHDPLL